jgi:hypothetical protein
MAEKGNREAAQQTFKQFAWNLAGTIADQKRGASKGQTRRGSAGGKR